MDKLISTTKAFFAVLLFLGLCFSAQHTYAQEHESPWSIGMNYSMMNNTLESSIPDYRGIGIQIERKLISRFSVGSELNWYSQQEYTRSSFGYFADVHRRSARQTFLYLKGEIFQYKFVSISLKSGGAWFYENTFAEGWNKQNPPHPNQEFAVDEKRSYQGFFVGTGVELSHKRVILYAEPFLVVQFDAEFTGISFGSKIRL